MLRRGRSVGPRAVVAMLAVWGLAAGRAAAQTPPPAPAGGSNQGAPAMDAGREVAEARAFFRGALDDPTLDRLIARAFEANLGLQAVRARIEGAEAERFRTTLDLVPAVTANGAYTRQRISGASFPGLGGTLPDQGLWEAGIQMSWDVDVFGRTRRIRDGRVALVDAAREDVQDARVLLAAEVAGAYFRLRGAQDRVAVARRNAENQERTLALTKDRLDQGRGTALDTERARAQLSTTRSRVPTLEALVTAEQNRIAVLLGRAPGALAEELGPDASRVELPTEVDIPPSAAVLERRPDVLGAERRVAASGAALASAKTGYLPQITIQGAAGYTATDFDALGGSGTPRYVVGPVVSWPLLDLGRVKATVDAARAQRTEFQARYEAAVLEAQEDVATSVTAYARARERLQNLEGAAEASERATELARLRFEEGAGDFLEVLDAERRLLEAQDLLSVGRTEATTALVAVYRALGGSWSEEGEGPG